VGIRLEPEPELEVAADFDEDESPDTEAEALWDASQVGDLLEMRRLLDAGAHRPRWYIH
jgi:hypothetical protein